MSDVFILVKKSKTHALNQNWMKSVHMTVQQFFSGLWPGMRLLEMINLT